MGASDFSFLSLDLGWSSVLDPMYLFLSVELGAGFSFLCFFSALSAISAFLWASSSSKVISTFFLGESRILR